MKSTVNISQTNAAKAQEELTGANREVMKSVNIDKRNNINSLAEEAEQVVATWYTIGETSRHEWLARTIRERQRKKEH